MKMIGDFGSPGVGQQVLTASLRLIAMLLTPLERNFPIFEAGHCLILLELINVNVSCFDLI